MMDGLRDRLVGLLRTIVLGVLAVVPSVVFAQSADRVAQIRVRGEVRVCMWPEYYTISYLNPRSGAFEGIDVDMARGLAQRLGVGLSIVPTDFRLFMDRLDQGDCDVAMFGIGITPQRAARVDFAQPYLRSVVYGVTMQNNRTVRDWSDIDRPGNVVAVASGTFMEPLMQRTLRHAGIVSVAPPQTREAELQSGRADVFMSDFPYTRRLLLTGQWFRIIEPPAGFGVTVYAPAVAKGDAEMLAAINAFVAEARADGTLARSAARHGLSPILID